MTLEAMAGLRAVRDLTALSKAADNLMANTRATAAAASEALIPIEAAAEARRRVTRAAVTFPPPNEVIVRTGKHEQERAARLERAALENAERSKLMAEGIANQSTHLAAVAELLATSIAEQKKAAQETRRRFWASIIVAALAVIATVAVGWLPAG